MRFLSKSFDVGAFEDDSDTRCRLNFSDDVFVTSASFVMIFSAQPFAAAIVASKCFKMICRTEAKPVISFTLRF